MVSIQGSTTAAAYQNDEVVAGRVNSYIALLTSDVVMKRVIDELGLSLTPAELAARVSATNVPPQTSIIDVAVTAESPDAARRLADTVAQEFVSYTDALETPTGEDGQKVHTTVVTPASEPHARHGERVVLGILVALAGLLLGAVAVWIRSLADPVVRTAYQAAAAARVPVLGRVNAAVGASVGDLDSYRRLRTRLRSAVDPSTDCVLEMAAADSHVDASTVALNTARAMELSGRRSILLDASVADPSVPAESATEPVRDADGGPDTLSVSGWAAEPDQVATKNSSELIERLRRDYDQVIIAAPPVLPTLTASAVSEYADTVLLLISPGRTTRRNVIRAVGYLEATGARLVGLVLVDDGDDGGRPEAAEAVTPGLQASDETAAVSPP